MPLGVVDLLESVEIDEQGGDRDVSPPGPGQHLLGAVVDHGTVGQASEGVMERLVNKERLCLLSF